jgi:hypothetical protein
MLVVENIKVFNFEGAMRGLRNPKDSWHLSDSKFDDEACIWPEAAEYQDCRECPLFDGFGNPCIPYIGPKDMKLAQAMIGAGTDEAKFLRQIFISMDITAPLYWWKEFDTYKVGTVANSCSTMHKLDAYPIERSMFSWDNVGDPGEEFWATVDAICAECERLRLLYKETGDKTYWRALVQLLPNAWMQKRTVTANYQVARAQYFARRFHKLTEWHTLCDVYMNLPYGKEFIGYEKQKKPAKIVEVTFENEDIVLIDENGKKIAYGALCDDLRKQLGL